MSCDGLKQSVLITGVSGAIGQALAVQFKLHGYKILGIDLDENGSDKCDVFFRIDLNEFVINDSYSEEKIKEIKNFIQHDGLNVLINNAACQHIANFDQLNLEDFQKVLNINLLAAFQLSKKFITDLKKVKGSIVNIGSIHSRLTKKGFISYAVSKAALRSLSTSMALDLGGGIRVNAIEPAAIETKMLRNGFGSNSKLYKKLQDCHPVKKIGSPEEVALLAHMIVDPGLQFLHGSIIDLSGGISGRLHDPE